MVVGDPDSLGTAPAFYWVDDSGNGVRLRRSCSVTDDRELYKHRPGHDEKKPASSGADADGLGVVLGFPFSAGGARVIPHGRLISFPVIGSPVRADNREGKALTPTKNVLETKTTSSVGRQ